MKCEMALQSYAQQVAHLEKVISDNMFTWECCARGGNKTASGGCNIETVDKVNKKGKKLPFSHGD